MIQPLPMSRHLQIIHDLSMDIVEEASMPSALSKDEIQQRFELAFRLEQTVVDTILSTSTGNVDLSKAVVLSSAAHLAMSAGLRSEAIKYAAIAKTFSDNSYTTAQIDNLLNEIYSL